MSRLIHRLVALTLLLGALSVPLPRRATAQRAVSSNTRVVGWNSVPAILARIKAPKFPARDFNITSYGAVADGKSDSTEAIRKAIAACNAAGGGRVVVPAGVFLTGAIHLKSNVNLYVSEGATLKFSTDPEKYLPAVYTRFEGTECMNYSPFIYAFEQENIAVTGGGTLDGSASDQNWWAWTRRRGKPNERVKWAKQLTNAEAKAITLERVLNGTDNWNPKTGASSFTNMTSATQTAIVLWPDGAPGAASKEPVDIPTLTPFLPLKEKATGAAIIVCPGGGYDHLANHEGAPVAEWLNSIGITAFVLKYRLGPRYHHPAPLQDAARAIRTIRAQAAEWKIDPERIGILGFSAGGHLASTIATHFDSGKPDAADPKGNYFR